MHDDVETRVTNAQKSRQRIGARRRIPAGLRQVHVEDADPLARETDERVDRGNLLCNGLEPLFVRRDIIKGRFGWVTQRGGRIHTCTIRRAAQRAAPRASGTRARTMRAGWPIAAAWRSLRCET